MGDEEAKSERAGGVAVEEIVIRYESPTKSMEATWGYDWDYVAVFPVHKQDAKLNEMQKKMTPLAAVKRLAAAHLGYKLYYGRDRDKIFLKIRASPERLKLEADRIDYLLMLDREQVKRSCEKPPATARRGRIHIVDTKQISKRNPYDRIYGKYDGEPHLQKLYRRYDNGEGVKEIFRGVDRMKLIMSIVEAPMTDGGAGMDPDGMVEHGAMLGFYPLHDEAEKEDLRKRWINPCSLPWQTPIDEIQDYFGEKVALYFGWLAHYTTFLIVPSLFGFIVWAHQAAENTIAVAELPVFGVFMALWATVFLEYWKRREATLAMEFGMIGFEDEEQPRPRFKGERIPSPITGREILYFSPMDKLKKLVASQAVVLVLIGAVITTVIGIFAMRNVLRDAGAFAVVGTGIVNALQIQFFNWFYGKVALKLTEWENHRTDTQFEDNLIAKTFLFQFVNSYNSMFYIAFFKANGLSGDDQCIGPCVDAGNGTCVPQRGPHFCMEELSSQLSSIFITRLVSGNLLEVGKPWLLRNVGAWWERRQATAELLHEKDAVREESDAELQLALDPYESTFDDFNEMVVQYGYVTLFVVAFPLAPALAVINNYAEMRIDAFKLCNNSRRPEPRGAEDIGTWQIILEIMGYAAVVTNMALIIFTSTAIPESSYWYDGAPRVWLFIILEHSVVMVKYLVALVVDDVPEDVQMQIRRQNFIVDKLILEVPDEDEEILSGAGTEIDLTIYEDDDCTL